MSTEVDPFPPEEFEAELDVDELHDRMLRTMAELDNFRKRTAKEIEQAKDAAQNEVLREFMLPLLDDMERAFRAAMEVRGKGALQRVREGVHLVLERARANLRRLEVEGYSSVGETFTAELMEAIAEIPSRELPPGTVASEIARGYKRRGKLLRPAQVAVAAAPEESDERDP